MANIFPNGISFLQKAPNALEVVEAQGRGAERGLAQGTQLVTNFMQGRRFAREEREAVGAEERTAETHRAELDLNKLRQEAESMRFQGEKFKLTTLQDEARRTLALDGSKTELSNLLTELTKTGDWSNSELLPRLYGMAAKHPDLANTDLFKEAIKNHQESLQWNAEMNKAVFQANLKPSPIKEKIQEKEAFLTRMKEAQLAGDEISAAAFASAAGVPREAAGATSTKYQALLEARQQGNNELVQVLEKELDINQPEELPDSDVVAGRQLDKSHSELRNGISTLESFSQADFDPTNVGPLAPVYRVTDALSGIAQSVPVVGGLAKGAYRTFAGDPDERAVVRSKVQQAVADMRKALTDEANPSNRELQIALEKLGVTDLLDTPTGAMAAIKESIVHLKRSDAYNRLDKLKLLPLTHPNRQESMQELVKRLSALDVKDPVRREITEDLRTLIAR